MQSLWSGYIRLVRGRNQNHDDPPWKCWDYGYAKSCPNVWSGHSGGPDFHKYLVYYGVDLLLSNDNRHGSEARILPARELAEALLYMKSRMEQKKENWTPQKRKEKELHRHQRIVDLIDGGESALARFYSKRIPCSCLDITSTTTHEDVEELQRLIDLGDPSITRKEYSVDNPEDCEFLKLFEEAPPTTTDNGKICYRKPASCWNPDCQILPIGDKLQMRRCGGCAVARYCSTDCQRAHWSDHKMTCSK